MRHTNFENHCQTIVRDLNNLENSLNIGNVIKLFHTHIEHFNDEQTLAYIDELIRIMKLDSNHGGLNWYGRTPEIGGIFLEELKNVQKSIQEKKITENK
jgi:hypothetical protein